MTRWTSSIKLIRHAVDAKSAPETARVMIDACLDLSDGLGIERALDPGSLGRDLME